MLDLRSAFRVSSISISLGASVDGRWVGVKIWKEKVGRRVCSVLDRRRGFSWEDFGFFFLFQAAMPPRAIFDYVMRWFSLSFRFYNPLYNTISLQTAQIFYFSLI